MAEAWPVYVLPIDGDPKFMDIPQNKWNDRFNWRFGSCRRIIETPYVTEDREDGFVSSCQSLQYCEAT